jgi:hypothetical protein
MLKFDTTLHLVDIFSYQYQLFTFPSIIVIIFELFMIYCYGSQKIKEIHL